MRHDTTDMAGAGAEPGADAGAGGETDAGPGGPVAPAAATPRTPVAPDPAGAAPSDLPPPRGLAWLARKLGPTGVLGLLWLTMPPLCSIVLFAYIQTISQWLRSAGDVRGVLVYIAAFILCAGLGLLPTYAQAILAGWAFGVGIGFPAALCGFGGAATLGYVVARTVSRGRIVDLIETNAKARAIRDALMGHGPLRTLGLVLLVRLPPNSPFALTNLVMAGVKVPPLIFVLGTIIGMAPRTFAAVYIGSQIESLTGNVTQPRWVVAAGIVLTLIVMGVIGTIANNAIKRVSGGSRGSRAEGAG